MLEAFASFMLLKANAFPRDCPVWNGNPVVDQLWSEWKRFFNPLQLALERKTAASYDHPGMFGTAAAAQQYHGILPELDHRYNKQGGNTQGLIDQLDGYFDNLAAASTNSHAAHEQIAAATKEQYARITAALDNLTAAANIKPSPRSTPNTTNPLSPTEKRVMEKIILTLQSAVKNKWKVGGVLLNTRSRRLRGPQQRHLLRQEGCPRCHCNLIQTCGTGQGLQQGLGCLVMMKKWAGGG